MGQLTPCSYLYSGLLTAFSRPHPRAEGEGEGEDNVRV